jgi:L-lactate dehydrogenase (cytochrome)/(S)-mandelate dehydrogenase
MKPYSLSWGVRTSPISVEGYRQRARAVLPKMVWSYVDGGADDLISLYENQAGFRRYRLRQRALTGVANPELGTRMADEAVPMPVALAPTGMSGLVQWRGDVAAARAAEAFGTRHVLSTAASYSLEEVAAATSENHWFQLYPYGNHEKVGRLIDRAGQAGYTSLFVTVDVPVVGNREGERLTGMGVPMQLTPRRCLDIALHPTWLAAFLRHQRFLPVHFIEPDAAGGSSLDTAKRTVGVAQRAAMAADAFASQARYMQGDMQWDDLAWMRERWKGRLYVKGIMDADDAAKAVDEIGVNGIVVSNHGARQLDRVSSTIDALGPIAARVGGRAEVFLDGGVRRGADVITALCLGAHGVFIGRPYLYGLAAAGEAGVRHVLEILQEEMRRSMILMGCPSVSALNRSWLV